MDFNILQFSKNDNVAIKDYIYHYYAEVAGEKGFVYDNTISFADKDAKMSKFLKKKVSELAQYNFEANDEISYEMFSVNPMIVWATFATVNSIIDAIIPDVIEKKHGLYSTKINVKNGENKAFDIKSNDLFYVSRVGRDKDRVAFQRQHTGTMTITPELRAISVATSLYKYLCGEEPLASLVRKAVISFEAQITKEIFTAFDTALDGLPVLPDGDGFRASGFTKATAIKLAQKVQANNNAKPIFVGTKLALSEILPDDANYRYNLESDYVKIGYIRDYAGYSVMELPQVAKTDGTGDLALKDNRVYILTPSVDKPVKIVYEGNSFSNTNANFANADLTQDFTMFKSYGIGFGTNMRVAVIDLP